MGDLCIIIVLSQPRWERNGAKFCFYLLTLVTLEVWVTQEREIEATDVKCIFLSFVLVVGVD